MTFSRRRRDLLIEKKFRARLAEKSRAPRRRRLATDASGAGCSRLKNRVASLRACICIRIYARAACCGRGALHTHLVPSGSSTRRKNARKSRPMAKRTCARPEERTATRRFFFISPATTGERAAAAAGFGRFLRRVYRQKRRRSREPGTGAPD